MTQLSHFVLGGLVVCVLDQALWERFHTDHTQTEQHGGMLFRFRLIYYCYEMRLCNLFNLINIKKLSTFIHCCLGDMVYGHYETARALHLEALLYFVASQH